MTSGHVPKIQSEKGHIHAEITLLCKTKSKNLVLQLLSQCSPVPAHSAGGTGMHSHLCSQRKTCLVTIVYRNTGAVGCGRDLSSLL